MGIFEIYYFSTELCNVIWKRFLQITNINDGKINGQIEKSNTLLFRMVSDIRLSYIVPIPKLKEVYSKVLTCDDVLRRFKPF